MGRRHGDGRSGQMRGAIGKRAVAAAHDDQIRATFDFMHQNLNRVFAVFDGVGVNERQAGSFQGLYGVFVLIAAFARMGINDAGNRARQIIGGIICGGVECDGKFFRHIVLLRAKAQPMLKRKSEVGTKSKEDLYRKTIATLDL